VYLRSVPPPSLVVARPYRSNAIRASFDAPPRALDPAAFHDALNPRNWSLRALPSGYAPPAIRVDPDATDPKRFDLVFLTSLHPDADYDLTASLTIEPAP
jgi:hypothetical protein